MKKMCFVLVLTLLFLFGCNDGEANIEKNLANNKARTVLTYSLSGNLYLSNGKCLDFEEDTETYCGLPYEELSTVNSIRIYFDKYYSVYGNDYEMRCLLIATMNNGTVFDASISCDNSEYYIFGPNAGLVRLPNVYCAYYLDDATKKSPYELDDICEGDHIEEAIAKAKDFEEMIIKSGLTMDGIVPYLQKFHDKNAEKLLVNMRSTSTILKENGVEVYFQFSNDDVYYDKYLIAHDINGNVVSDDIVSNIARYLETDELILTLDSKTTFVLSKTERFMVNFVDCPDDTGNGESFTSPTMHILKYFNDEYEEIINFDYFSHKENTNRVYAKMKSGCYLSLEGELPKGYDACSKEIDTTSVMELYGKFNEWFKHLGLEKSDLVYHTIVFWDFHAYPALLKYY